MGSNPTLSAAACALRAVALVSVASAFVEHAVCSIAHADDAAASAKRDAVEGERELQTLLEQSDAAFEGFVERVAAVQGGAGCHSADVMVIRTWKGADQERVSVELCGYEAKPQTGHLFFAKSVESGKGAGHGAPALRVASGSGSRPSEEAGDAFRFLGAGVTPVDRGKLSTQPSKPLKSALQSGRYERAGCQSCALAAYAPQPNRARSSDAAQWALAALVTLLLSVAVRVSRRTRRTSSRAA